MRTKYIFITGGVISSLGKGITSASVAALLQARGYKVTCVKCDAYVNIDAGTMNPTEHGEVFVTVDGMETDQDLGNYERFLNRFLSSANYLTTGQAYQKVIERERNLEYEGKCVDVVFHIPEEITRRLKEAAKTDQADIVIAEIGGTVGEYQNILFIEVARQLKRVNANDVTNIHVTYLPIPATVGEMKSKPAQNSIRTLQSSGVQPEFVIGRSRLPLDDKRKERISIFGNVEKEKIFSNPDVDSIYKVPLILEEQGLTDQLIKSLRLPKSKTSALRGLAKWKGLVKSIESAHKLIKVGVVGKYFDSGDYMLEDSYISVIEAIKHAAWSLGLKPEVQWIDCQDFEKSKADLSVLKNFQAIIVPGGFGSRGVEGKIKVIEYARKNKIPWLGLCYGMQLAVVEFARNVLGLKGAHTEEINPKTKYPVIHFLPEQKKLLAQKKYGATMRLGSYNCQLVKGSLVQGLYNKININERHRHRYEFNNKYKKDLENKGMKVVGLNKENGLVEIVELKDHPFFVGTQFHPEFQSGPFNPQPLFVGLLKAGV